VEVTWVAAVARSGSFRNSEIVDYTLTHEKVETAWLTKQRYGFAEKSQSSPSEKSEAIKAVSYDSLERTRPWLALSRLYESSSKGPSLLEVLNINESQLMLSDLLQAPQTPQPTLLEILARSKEPEG
jgi:hypothetical protein